MIRISALIIDDEELARENLKLLLNEFCKEVDVVATGNNIDEAKTLMNKYQPDAIFLDIRMPSGEEGLELLEENNLKNTQIVFVTAFKDYAIKAFNANAIHYLLKPIDIEELIVAVKKLKQYKKWFAEDDNNAKSYQKALHNLNETLTHFEYPHKITISHAKGIKIINDSDILYLEGDGNCTKIYFINGESFLDTRTLKIYEDFLNPKLFYRIHKKYIINNQYLSDYRTENGYYVILKNKINLPVARARTNHFVNYLKTIN